MAARAKTRRRLILYLPHPLPIWRLPQGYVERIRKAAARVFDLDVPLNEQGLEKVLPEAEVLYAWGVAQRLVPVAHKLKWLHTPLTGVDRVLNPELTRTSIRVTCSRGVNSVSVAEHVFGLVLSLTRGIVEAAQAQKDRRWTQNDLYGRRPGLSELHGRLMGIYGLGEIGQELAHRAHAFGMRVWGVSRTARRTPQHVERVFPPQRAETLVRHADVLVLALPLTEATRGLVGERLLNRMKPGSILVNIGRGALVQEPALARALREGWIGGAALDVFATEPLPPQSPLWTLPNVILTPHVAGFSPRIAERHLAVLLDNVGRFARGEPLGNVVNKALWY